MDLTLGTPSINAVPAWYPDPSARYQLRYWDGFRWTPEVSVNGQHFIDHPLHSGAVPTGWPPGERLADDPMMRWIFPVGRSGLAIAAGYAGLLGLVVFPAPVALLLGIFAAIDLRRHPNKLGWGRAIFGLTVGILGTGIIVVSAIAFG